MLIASALSDDPVKNLQLGLGVELAVLPPYLYALWSIREGASTPAAEAANSIRAVIYEEMLHAGLVGNILNALGTKPDVTAHLMTYPGPLPGHIKTGKGSYTVSLGPLSQSTIKTFMLIENPNWLKPEDANGGWTTIAELYDKVIAELKKSNPPFAGGRQLPLGDNPGPGRMVQVDGLAWALEAIKTVIDQGEGHKPHKPGDVAAEDDDDHEVAHFDQFATIAGYFKDKLIDAKRDLFPVIENPNATKYSPDQKKANAAFNQIYTAVLDSLQAMWNTASPRVWGAPTDLMAELAHAAAVLRNLGPVPGTTTVAGPTFEYLGSPAGGSA